MIVNCWGYLLLGRFRCYLEGSNFEIFTDNQLQKSFFTKQKLISREARWIGALGNFCIFPITLKPGNSHIFGNLCRTIVPKSLLLIIERLWHNCRWWSRLLKQPVQASCDSRQYSLLEQPKPHFKVYDGTLRSEFENVIKLTSPDRWFI